MLAPDRQEATPQQVVALLAAAAPGNPEDPTSWITYAQLAPHVLVTDSLGGDSPSRQLVLDTTRCLHAKGALRGSW
jgi:hypothetical protein